ncbi:hypothetical protein EBT16_03480, partial [bacterium]|nr:hypothetical protein [bacterium]
AEPTIQPEQAAEEAEAEVTLNRVEQINSQKQNLEAALSRLEGKLERLHTRPIPRKNTAPPKRSVKERLLDKKAHGIKKKLRSKKSNEWD